MEDKIEDKTQVDVTKKEGDDKGTPSQIDQGEFDKAKVEAKALTDLLEDHGFDSIEDATKALSSGKDLKDQLGDADLKTVLEDAKTKASWEDYWAAEDLKKKEEGEEPDDKVTRLEKRITDFETKEHDKEVRRDGLQKSQETLEGFNTEIKTLVEKNEAIPEEYRPFAGEFLGVDNPANEVEITNMPEVRKMAKEGIKKIQAFEQAVIKRYREGKLKVPDITPTEPIDTEAIKEHKPKNLAESKKMAMEILQKQLSRTA